MSVYIFKQAHPSPEILSLTDAKEHLKVDVTDDDAMIIDMIQAAIEACENYTGSVINESKYEIRFDGFIDKYEFKLSPVQSIDEVGYQDDADNPQTITDVELLPVDKFGSIIHYTNFNNIPTQKEGTRVIVKITAGYADGKTPKAIISAIKLIIGDLYDNRQDKVHKLPTRSMSLLRKYRFYY